MTLQTDLQAAVESAQADAALLRAIVQGPPSGPTSIVMTEGGQVKTLARVAAETDAFWVGLGYSPVDKAGDTMVGNLTLAGAPVNSLHAATKAYVDARALKAGDTFTGPLVVNTGTSPQIRALSSGFTQVQAETTGAGQQARLEVKTPGATWLWYTVDGSNNFSAWNGAERLTIGPTGIVNVPGLLTPSGGVANIGGISQFSLLNEAGIPVVRFGTGDNNLHFAGGAFNFIVGGVPVASIGAAGLAGAWKLHQSAAPASAASSAIDGIPAGARDIVAIGYLLPVSNGNLSAVFRKASGTDIGARTYNAIANDGTSVVFVTPTNADVQLNAGISQVSNDATSGGIAFGIELCDIQSARHKRGRWWASLLNGSIMTSGGGIDVADTGAVTGLKLLFGGNISLGNWAVFYRE